MAMTFDATLKDMARESPQGFLTAFDRPPALPVKLLNVDLSTVTSATDLVLGLGEPLEEAIHFEFQSSAAAWKHADLLVYNALLYAEHHVPAHTIVVLLRPQAAHPNMNGRVSYAARPEHGRMEFHYEVVRLWERPADELLAADIGVTPLAVLGQLPDGPLDDALAAVVHQIVERVMKEAPAERATKLLTDALLLTGLRVRRELAAKIFRGVRMMEESDTYLMILEEGEARGIRKTIMAIGERRLGPPPDFVRTSLKEIADLDRLARIALQVPNAASWQEIVGTL